MCALTLVSDAPTLRVAAKLAAPHSVTRGTARYRALDGGWTSRTPSRLQSGAPLPPTREYGSDRGFDHSPGVVIKVPRKTVLKGVAGGGPPQVWGRGAARCIPAPWRTLKDERELAELRALNARIEALHGRRWRPDGTEDPAVVIAIDALESEAAALIRARSDRMPPPEGVSIGHEEALEYLRSLERPEVGSAGDTTPPRSTPPGRS